MVHASSQSPSCPHGKDGFARSNTNNPLVRTDPTGMYAVGLCNADANTCKNMASNLKGDYWNIVNARFKAIEAGDTDSAVRLGTSLGNLGAPGEKNAAGETDVSRSFGPEPTKLVIDN